MNYGGPSNQQSSYGQVPMQQGDYSGMKMNNPNSQNSQNPNPNYYNMQQNQMVNPRKCSTTTVPNQMALNQQMNPRKYSTATAPEFMSSQQNPQQIMNPRKCSTVIEPDQLRMQQMMPPPSSHHMQQNSQQIQQRRFSQHQPPQMQNLMPSMHQQSSTSSPHQTLISSPNQPQQSSPNIMQISPNQQQMIQVSPNQQHQNSPIQHHKNSQQQNMSYNNMQMGQQSVMSNNQMAMNQHKNSLQHQNSMSHQHLSPMPIGQQAPTFNQLPMGQQQASQPHISPTPQHKYSLQHQLSIPSSQQLHLSPHPTQQQISPNQQQMISPVSQQQQAMQHMSLQHQSSQSGMQQPQSTYHSQQNPISYQQTSSTPNVSSYNLLRDCTPPPQLKSYKMDQAPTSQYNYDISPTQPTAYGNRQTTVPMEMQPSNYPNVNQQLPQNPTQNSNFMHKQQCNPTASDDFYVRQQPDYYNQQQWRKASLACNFRLNPTRKESSISPNTNVSNSSTNYPNYNYENQMAPNRTTSCAFNEPPKLRENSTSYNPNFAHRSQSLSAAEFLRRNGSSDISTGAQVGNSLRRFSSQLRTHKPSNMGTTLNKHSSLATLYTPPPILSPLRSGIGLYRSISRQERKISSLVTALSLKRMDEDQDSPSTSHLSNTMGPNTEPIKNGQISRKASTIGQQLQEGEFRPQDSQSVPMFTDPLDLEQARASLTGRKPFIRPKMDNRTNAPQRKNGLFLSGAAQGSDGSAFAAELEALRKESASSTQSNQESAPRRMSIVRNSKLSLTVPNHDDILRKLSSTSIDEPSRKLSSTSDTYYDYTGIDSDVTPHINLGKAFQARVKKWSPREISEEERDAIPDRDDLLFDHKVIDHIPQRAVAAYEALSCSQAVPRPGRNKELALHILMENQGNLQAAVMDLLRSDTLDWEQYPIIFNNLYLDVDNWTPEDIVSFQDAIYKSEKDFHQVSSELGNRTVKQCVGFYYTWKKCCPDDYRKLRNLRRKRLLLEQQLDYSTFTDRQRTQSESQAQIADGSDDESEGLGLESDATSVASVTFNRPYSPYEDSRGEKYPRLALGGSPLDQFKVATSSQHFAEIAAMKAQQNHDDSQSALANVISAATSSSASNFPWLHGEFPSPGSSNANSSYSQPPSVGSLAMDLFTTEGSGMPVLHQKTHRPSANKKGAQPSADGFFHCRLCEKRFEKVKSLNAHMKSHAMKARAEAEAQAQLQHKHQQKQQNQMQIPQQSPLSMALGAAVRLQQQQGNFSGHHGRLPDEIQNDDRSPNESLSPLNFLTSGAVQQQQNQQQQQAFLRLFSGHNPFSAAQLAASAANDAVVSQAMSQLTAAQFAFGQQPPPDLQNVLAQMPTTQANQNAATALEQLHLQQNHLQHSATIMH